MIVFQEWFKCVSKVFPECFNRVSIVFRKCFMIVLWIFKSCLFVWKSSQLPEHMEALFSYQSSKGFLVWMRFRKWVIIGKQFCKAQLQLQLQLKLSLALFSDIFNTHPPPRKVFFKHICCQAVLLIWSLCLIRLCVQIWSILMQFWCNFDQRWARLWSRDWDWDQSGLKAGLKLWDHLPKVSVSVSKFETDFKSLSISLKFWDHNAKVSVSVSKCNGWSRSSQILRPSKKVNFTSTFH